MISSASVCRPVENRPGVFRERLSARLAAVALQTLRRGSVFDDIALIGLSSVWTAIIWAEIANLCKLRHDGRLFLQRT
jgi:hypothetical protein